MGCATHRLRFFPHVSPLEGTKWQPHSGWGSVGAGGPGLGTDVWTALTGNSRHEQLETPSLDTQAVSSALSTGYLTPRSVSHLLLPERNLNPVAVKEAYLFHGFLIETFWQSCWGHFGYGVREAGILGSYNSATFWPNDLIRSHI